LYSDSGTKKIVLISKFDDINFSANGEVGEWLSSPPARFRHWRKNQRFANMYYTYIIHSEKFGRYYTGHCKSCESRLKDHNRGKVKSTKAYIPWKIVYTEEFATKSEAFNREMGIKSYKSGEAFKKLVNKNI